MEPLLLLREFTMKGKKVKEEKGNLVFDKYVYPKNTETAWKSSQGKNYALDAIWLLIQNADKKHSDYLKLSKDIQTPVNFLDRSAILSYLRGEIDSHPNLGVFFPVTETKKDEAQEPVSTVPSIVAPPEEILEEERKKLEDYLMKDSLNKKNEEMNLRNLQIVKFDTLALKDVLKKERYVRTRISVLQSNKKHFTNIITSVTKLRKKEIGKKENEKKPEKRKGHQMEHGKASKEKGGKPEEHKSAKANIDAPKLETPPSKKKKLDSTNPLPLIIVPSAMTSVITLFNAQDFLERGVFIPSMDKKKEGAKKEPIVITRDKGGQKISYQVLEDLSSPADVDRLVAVFAQGAAWQFKKWPSGWNDPVHLFHKIPGFYVKYEEDKVPDLVKSWDVKILNFSKVSTKKHLASTAYSQFWDQVDYHCSLKKISLNT